MNRCVAIRVYDCFVMLVYRQICISAAAYRFRRRQCRMNRCVVTMRVYDWFIAYALYMYRCTAKYVLVYLLKEGAAWCIPMTSLIRIRMLPHTHTHTHTHAVY